MTRKSPDGITWTSRDSGVSGGWWRSVTYGGGQFVAVGLNRVMSVAW